MTLDLRRETACLFRSLAIWCGQRAVQPFSVPTYSGADRLVETELAGNRRDVQIGACAHEHEIVAATFVLGDLLQSVREQAFRNDSRHEPGSPFLDRGAAAAAHGAADEGLFDGGYV